MRVFLKISLLCHFLTVTSPVSEDMPLYRNIIKINSKVQGNENNSILLGLTVFQVKSRDSTRLFSPPEPTVSLCHVAYELR